eukprot:403345270
MSNQLTSQCRICLQKIKEFDYLSAVNPCLCQDAQKFVHHNCLKNWLDSSKTTSCQVCHFTYEKCMRKDGCGKIAKNVIKSRRFDLVLYVLCYYTFFLLSLKSQANNALRFTFQMYPSTSMLFCPTSYENVTSQLSNGTLTQDQLSIMCNYAINKITSFPEFFPIPDSLVISIINQIIGANNSESLKFYSISKLNLNKNLDRESNFTTESCTIVHSDENFNVNSIKETQNQNSSQNAENQSISSNLNMHEEHKLFQISELINLTDFNTLDLSDLEQPSPTIWKIFSHQSTDHICNSVVYLCTFVQFQKLHWNCVGELGLYRQELQGRTIVLCGV